MKKYLHALAMCRSMFCAIPCFWRVWDEEARDKMLLFLPIVGLETGAIWALLAWLCRYLALPALVQGAVLGAYPFVVTGFIHLDGFSREGKVIDETLESWEGSLSPKQREAFADALYTVLTASGAKTLSDLNGDKLKSAVTMLKTYSNLDRETRQLLSGSLRALVGSYAKNVADDVQKNDLEPLRRKLERQRKKAEKRGAKKK